MGICTEREGLAPRQETLDEHVYVIIFGVDTPMEKCRTGIYNAR